MTADTPSAAASALAERTEFLHRTYQHLALAIAAFIGLEALLLSIPGIESFVAMMTSSRAGWLLVLGAFMGVSYVADRWASATTSRATQYVGLGLYIVAEAVIFLPLLYYAAYVVGGDVLVKSAVTTGVVFGGLTATVLISKRDFSFLGGFLKVAGFGAMGLIVVSLLFGFTLGNLFAGAMAVFAAGAIVYSTSNILHRYRPDQHVAAALSLFASVALLFWYVLSFLLGSRR